MRTALTALPPAASLSAVQLQAMAVDLRLLIDRAQVVYLEHLAAVRVAPRPAGSPDPVAALIREVNVPGRVIRGEAALASALHDTEAQCETTTQLLRAGDLSVEQARSISRAIAALPTDDAAEVEPVLAQLCADHPPAATDQLCRNARALAQQQNADARDARAHSARALHLRPFDDGVRVEGQVSTADGALLAAAIDSLAAPRDADDTRTMPQRRADALIGLARRALTGGELPAVAGVRPHVHLTIDIQDLLDRTSNAHLNDSFGSTAGPRAIRQLSCDSVLDVAVTQAVGAKPPDDLVGFLLRRLSPALGGSTRDVLYAGRTTRLVTPAQRRALWVRDQGCAYPGCTSPPPQCEAHHLVHWADGGRTDLDNLALACARHHHALHAEGDILVRGPDGRFVVHHGDALARAAA